MAFTIVHFLKLLKWRHPDSIESESQFSGYWKQNLGNRNIKENLPDLDNWSYPLENLSCATLPANQVKKHDIMDIWRGRSNQILIATVNLSIALK